MMSCEEVRNYRLEWELQMEFHLGTGSGEVRGVMGCWNEPAVQQSWAV